MALFRVSGLCPSQTLWLARSTVSILPDVTELAKSSTQGEVDRHTQPEDLLVDSPGKLIQVRASVCPCQRRLKLQRGGQAWDLDGWPW